MRASRLLLLLPAVAALLSVSLAVATARYDHSTPAPEDALPASPDRIDIFTHLATSAAPGDTQIIVIDRDQQRVDLGDVVVDAGDHRHFSVGVKPQLPAGRYVVTFKTLGESDFDHDGGDFAFYVGMQPTTADRAADRSLAVTIPSEDVNLTGYRRGIVEGGLTLVIAAPAAFYYVIKRRKGKQAVSVDSDGLPRK